MWKYLLSRSNAYNKGLSADGFHVKFCKLGCWWDYRKMFSACFLMPKASSKILFHYFCYIFFRYEKKPEMEFTWTTHDAFVSPKCFPVNDVPKSTKGKAREEAELRPNWLFNTKMRFLISLLFHSLSFSIINVLMFKYLCYSIDWNAKCKCKIFECKIFGVF